MTLRSFVDERTAETRMACGVPEDEALWIATWLFNSPITSRPSGAHDGQGVGFSGFFGEVKRCRQAYAALRAQEAE